MLTNSQTVKRVPARRSRIGSRTWPSHRPHRRLLQFESLEERRLLAANPNPAAFANANPNFNGIGFTGATPPDTVGDVGTNHYIQMVNSQFQIFDKQGNSLAGPFNISTPWVNAGVGTVCQNRNDGDPYVVYDHLADRWVISQFAVPNGTQATPNAQCIAVSQNADPVNGPDGIPNNGDEWFPYEYLFDNVANPVTLQPSEADVGGNGGNCLVRRNCSRAATTVRMGS